MNSSTTPDCKTASPCRISRDFEYLRQLEAFSGTPPEVVKLFAYLVKHRLYAAGQCIVAKGDPADCAFLVIKGSIAIVTIHKQAEVSLQHLDSGSFCGGMALLARFAWPFTARAITETEIIIIDRESFRKVMEKYPERQSAVVEKIIQLRIARMEQQTHNMLDLILASGLESNAKGKSSIL